MLFKDQCILLYLICIPFLLLGHHEVLLFQRLSVAENLTSQSYNYYVFKDSYGFVWISSIDGLNRFDGHEVKQYLHDEEDSLSIADNNIQSAFFEDPKGNLWFSTLEAIHCYKRRQDHFEKFYLKKGGLNIQGEYKLLYLDTLANHLWIRINQDLFIYNIADDTQQSMGTFPLSIQSQITKVENSSDYYLFIPNQKEQELHIKRFTKDGELYGETTLDEFQVTGLFYENETHLWLGTKQGLVCFNLSTGTYQSYSTFEHRPINYINSIVAWGTDKLVISTKEEGIFFFNKDSMSFGHQVYMNEAGILSKFQYEIHDMYLDSDQTLWISSSGQGVYFTNLDKKKFTSVLQHHSGESKKRSYVKAMTKDLSGRYWCTSRDGLVVLDDSGEAIKGMAKFHQDAAPFKNGEPFFIFCDKSGRIWVCDSKGLAVLWPGRETFEYVFLSTGFHTPASNYIYQLDNGKLLVSTLGAGLLEVVEDGEKLWLEPIKGIPTQENDYYTLIYEDSDGNIFWGRNQSDILVFEQKNDEFSLIRSIGLKAMVTTIIEDIRQPILWVATSIGLFYLDKRDTSLMLKHETSFPSQSLKGLLQDELTGNLWVSSNRGLLRYDTLTKDLRYYSLADGIQSKEFNFWSCFKARKDLFAFGGVNGLNFFNPADIKDLETSALPTITGIYINDQATEDFSFNNDSAHNVSHIRILNLNYDQNTLSFRFAAREYSDPASNKFKYRMTGIDDSWVESGTENFARYADLPWDTYTFEVDATNSDGIWSGKPHKLKINIKPPWYQTLWFRALVLIFLIFLLYLGYKYRVREINKRAELAEYKQRIAETETAILRLQMSPHFIFNSMNSISSYMLKNDMETANDYLIRFSRLMRKILTLSEQPLIPLYEEKELLAEYLNTEAMRFDNKFEYFFEEDESLDLDETFIPTMILQPFVENAILHGVAHNGRDGKITIRFEKGDNALICSVTDNGIGRVAAKKLNRNAEKHESKAIKITQRRLRLLEQEHRGSASLKTIDLYNEEQKASGTKVILKLPLL